MTKTIHYEAETNYATAQRILAEVEAAGFKFKDGLQECDLSITIENILIYHNKAMKKGDQ